jgi:hypothetical protein
VTEKDHYGETLRNREKGEEDRYAAEQDRLRIEKLRQQAQTPQAVNGLCPHCSIPLNKSQKVEVTVHACPRCRGVWLAVEDLDKVLARGSEGEIAQFVRRLLT